LAGLAAAAARPSRTGVPSARSCCVAAGARSTSASFAAGQTGGVTGGVPILMSGSFPAATGLTGTLFSFCPGGTAQSLPGRPGAATAVPPEPSMTTASTAAVTLEDRPSRAHLALLRMEDPPVLGKFG
jgi:hypothetical protein